MKMNKGYKLKSIEIGTYSLNSKSQNDSDSTTYKYEKQQSSLTYKKIKNNSTITLGTITNYDYLDSYYQSGSYLNTRKCMSNGILAPTYIRITYVDKYSKLNCTASYYVIRFAK